MDALWVGAGGFVGSVLRYGLGRGLALLGADQGFPVGTLAVNVIGCLAIGYLAGLGAVRASSDGLRLFVVVVVLGGFTTFSAFGNETFELLRQGQPLGAGANVALHLLVALPAAFVGHSLAR